MPFSQKNTEFDKQCRTAAAELGTPFFSSQLLSSSSSPPVRRGDFWQPRAPVWISAGFSHRPCGGIQGTTLRQRFTSCYLSGWLTRAWINSHPVQQKDVKGMWSKCSTPARSFKSALVSPINQKQQRRQAPGESPPAPKRTVCGFKANSGFSEGSTALIPNIFNPGS